MILDDPGEAAAMEDSFNTIKYDKEENIGIITLNRPERLNAISLEMRQEIGTL